MRVHVNLFGVKNFGVFDPVSIESVLGHYYYNNQILGMVRDINSGRDQYTRVFGGVEMAH
jgi:hypothetical protein